LKISLIKQIALDAGPLWTKARDSKGYDSKGDRIQSFARPKYSVLPIVVPGRFSYHFHKEGK
jgi:hypothetical protein